jgi:hypothetical protein
MLLGWRSFVVVVAVVVVVAKRALVQHLSGHR